MPGDTYTPSPKYGETVLDHDNVLEFRRARQDLIPESTIQAERNVQDAYAQHEEEKTEYIPSPVEIAAFRLRKIREVRTELAA